VLGAGLLGRTVPGRVLCLQIQRGRVQTKRARGFASGTGVYLISAWSVRRTGRIGRTRTQGNIFADIASSTWTMYSYSYILEQHRKDVSNILETITNSGVKVKPSKCEFHKSGTAYLGFIIGQEGVKTDLVKTQDIWDWTTPHKIKEIQYFLGFCNFYRRFIKGFSWGARPLEPKQKSNALVNRNSGTQNNKRSTNCEGNLHLHQYWSSSISSHQPISKKPSRNM